MGTSRLPACAAVALLAAALAAPAVVDARGKADSEVRLKEVREVGPGTAEYRGKVRSSKSRCRRNRKVTVIHNSNPPFVIGEALTDDQGRWSILGPLPPPGDTITVKVKKNSKCKGDKQVYEIDATN